MKIASRLYPSELRAILLKCGFQEEPIHGFYVPLKPTGRIHAIFSSEGLEIHKDSSAHKVVPWKEITKWVQIVKYAIRAEEIKQSP